MRPWSLRAGDPLDLRLAADPRSGSVDPFRDVVWEVGLKGGKPPGLAVRSGYGRRGVEARLFPSFQIGSKTALDPQDFASPPTVVGFLPSSLEIECQPLPGLATSMTYWVPDSRSLLVRVRVENQMKEALHLRLRTFVSLSASEGQQPMQETVLSGARHLQGGLGGEAIVIFLTGGAAVEVTGLPCLVVEADVAPAAKRHWALVHVMANDGASAFDSARKWAAAPLEAHLARVEQLNAGLVDIDTGDRSWNAVLAFSQVAGLRSLIGGTRRFRRSAFVSARRPESGFSAAGDGREYEPEWSGQSLWQARHLAHAILPAAPEWGRGVVLDFLETQSGDGTIDASPGWSGKRSGRRAPPLLASLAAQLLEGPEAPAFLGEVYPRLEDFVGVWLGREADQDQDGWPEWDTAAHAGMGLTPAFGARGRGGLRLDPRCIEAPDLAAYLYAEIASLVKVARGLGKTDSAERWEPALERLAREVGEAWANARGLVRPRDRTSHASPKSEPVAKGRGEFRSRPRRTLNEVARLLIRLEGDERSAAAVEVTVRGRGPDRKPVEERFGRSDFAWSWEKGTALSRHLFTSVERVEVAGAPAELHSAVSVADLTREDITGLLPLWAGDLLSRHVDRLVDSALLDVRRFWRPFGVPSCSAADSAYAPDETDGAGVMVMAWNAMLAEGLAMHGRAEEAGDLIRRMLAAAAATLSAEGSFREFYSPETGEGRGQVGHIGGLFPVMVLLKVAGIQLMSPTRLRIHGPHVFPRPLELRWRGLLVRRERDGTHIEFPDGGASDLPSSGDHLVEQETITATPEQR